jgi:voltage-gated potassium channel
MDIRKRLFFVLLAVFIVTMGGTFGYYLLYSGQSRFIDCMYMTVISLTGVGYGEVTEVTGNIPAEIFTMALITFGMGIIFYGISTLAAMIIEGDLSGILRRQKMVKQIKKLKNHYIVCGGGETGRPLIAELVKNMKTVVLIEASGEAIERCRSICDLLYIEGDATDDQNLIAAGIANAAGIIVCLQSDKDCLYVTMTARMLNKRLRIISRMTDPKHRAKLKKAGADGIVSPNAIGALRMASEMIRPTVVDFLDTMLRSKKVTLRIGQITVWENAAFEGMGIRDSGIKDKFGLLILGLKKEDGDILFNPPPSQVLEKGMTLIVMGDVADIERARKAL